MTRRLNVTLLLVLVALVAFWAGVFVILHRAMTYEPPRPTVTARNEWGQTYEDAEAARERLLEW